VIFVFRRVFPEAMASESACVSASVSGMKRSRNQSPAQLRARAAQTAGCCDKYVGMAVFAAQMSLDSDSGLRKFMLDHESLETAELWWKLHEHNYHCTKQDVSRFKTLRKSGKRRLAPPEEGDLLAKAEAERVAAWEAQVAAQQTAEQKRTAERAAAAEALQQQEAAEKAAAEKAAAEKELSDTAAQRTALVGAIEAAAEKAAQKVAAAQSSTSLIVPVSASASDADASTKFCIMCGAAGLPMRAVYCSVCGERQC